MSKKVLAITTVVLIVLASGLWAEFNVGDDGKVRIADGTEGTGKVLTSDSAGTASWQNPPA